MPVRAVVGDVVEDDLQPPRVRRRHQRIEIPQCAEEGIHLAVVRDIVAEIHHGRRKEGRDPERVHPQPAQVIEAGGDPAQIAHPVIVTVLERAGVDLVNDPALPPEWLAGCAHFAMSFLIRAARSFPSRAIIVH